MDTFFNTIKTFWPLVGTCINFCFPFISQLKKKSIHFDDESRAISNILAGIASAASLLILYFERHELHYILHDLPKWYWLIFIGIGLVTVHCALVSIAREWSEEIKNTIRGIGIVVYVLAFMSLTLGFNIPLVERFIYIPIGGEVGQNCHVKEIQLLKDDKMIARSPVFQDGAYRTYRFLLLPTEIRQGGLKVGANRQHMIIVSKINYSYPQLDLDILCTQ